MPPRRRGRRAGQRAGPACGPDAIANARQAIDHAGSILADADAIVLYVRDPLEGFAAHLEGHAALEDVRAIDAALRDAGERLAAGGVGYARRAGLRAEARVASATDAVADTIVRVADELDASLMVIGSRGRRALKPLVLGSVSQHVVHHTRRPAIVVPSPLVSAVRAHVSDDIPEILVAQTAATHADAVCIWCPASARRRASATLDRRHHCLL